MIVVAGEALMDLFVAPDGSVAANPGGGPYNTARTIARLGQPVTFLGRISSDRFGRDLRANLERDGVSADGVIETDDPTTLALVELDEHGVAGYHFYVDGTSAAGLTDAEAAAVMAGRHGPPRRDAGAGPGAGRARRSSDWSGMPTPTGW